VANVSEDRVALHIGRLTLRLIAAEQELDEVRGMYRQLAAPPIEREESEGEDGTQ